MSDEAPVRAPGHDAPSFGVTGDARARLLAGPTASLGAENLAAHISRLGPVPNARRGPALLQVVSDSGLAGRGGAGFPTATKLAVANASPGTALVVVNASESEPASFKDRTLVWLRPHTVLDGATLVAEAIGADEVIVQLHRGDRAGRESMSRALAERKEVALDAVSVRLSLGPDRFVAGESSAVVAFIEGAPAKPRPGRRAAISGVHGRPTLVQNAETLAHIALLARRGAEWFRQSGTADAPGSVLVTVHGDVAYPGTVFEVWGTATVGELVAAAGVEFEAAHGAGTQEAAVLVGGYGGTWVTMDGARSLPVFRDGLARSGVSLGCGVLGVIARGSCGLAETARILTYLAGESAGQCGPCAFGLPELAELAQALAAGRLSRAGCRRLPVLADSIAGRGGCAHPDGAVALFESALAVFSDDLRRHVRHRPCEGWHRSGSLPLPGTVEEWR
ncbi:MAG: NADH-ubiquinone oxidoreductase-F iron-sulfur binding region domain-containing protein [Acidimicrobiales bacterium]